MSNIDNTPVIKSTSAAMALLTGNQVSRTAGGGSPFLRFDSKRTGSWLLGQNAEDRSEEVFSLDVESLQHGFVLWVNKRPDRRLVPINQPLPIPQDASGEDQPSEARSMEGTFADGTSFVYECSTFGGRKAVDNLLAELFQRANAKSPFIFPQVKLENSSYEHSSYGEVLEPVLTAVAWFDESGTQEGEALIEAPEADEEEDEAPRRRTRKK